MEGESIVPNKINNPHISKFAIDTNTADLIKGVYVKKKNELTHVLRQASIRRHKLQKQKLQTEDSSQAEQVIARRLPATVEVRYAKIKEGNFKVVQKYCADNANSRSKVTRGIQSEDGKLLNSQEDIVKEVIKFYSTRYKNDIGNEKAKEKVVVTYKKTIMEE